MTEEQKEIERLKAEVETLKAKLTRPGGKGAPKNEEIRKAVFKMLDEGKGNQEIIGKTVKGTKISEATFYRVKKEWKSQKQD